MDSVTFWNEVGSTKDFEDPLYFDKLKPFLSLDAQIVEYGCGYGRLLHELFTKGYHNVSGYDFAWKMVQRGNELYPQIPLTCLSESGKIPLQDISVDAVILSTVLCCVVDQKEQQRIVDDIRRILKSGGVLYVTDFLISSSEKFLRKYQESSQVERDWGVYTTSEGAVVRHHTAQWIMQLLHDFDIQWFEQFDFKTMNHNEARTFHCLAQRVTCGAAIV